jgi:hypothetical protein
MDDVTRENLLKFICHINYMTSILVYFLKPLYAGLYDFLLKGLKHEDHPFFIKGMGTGLSFGFPGVVTPGKNERFADRIAEHGLHHAIFISKLVFSGEQIFGHHRVRNH